MDYNIEKKSKSFENHEGMMGCLFSLIIGGLIALVIWTSMRWYMGMFFGIGLVGLGTLFLKEWDLKYVDVFLSRMESLKKEDPALFLFTLNRWIMDLPAKDRAKPHFINLIRTSIQENATLKPELDKYTEIFGPMAALEELDDLEQLEKELDAPDVDKGIVEKKKNNSKKKVAGKIFCPRCGSTVVNEDTRGFSWGKGIIASAVLGPLGGAIVGSSKEGEPIYVCMNCNNKWKR